MDDLKQIIDKKKKTGTVISGRSGHTKEQLLNGSFTPDHIPNTPEDFPMDGLNKLSPAPSTAPLSAPAPVPAPSSPSPLEGFKLEFYNPSVHRYQLLKEVSDLPDLSTIKLRVTSNSMCPSPQFEKY